MGIYEMSVGRSVNLLPGIGPTAQGCLPARGTARLLELGQASHKTTVRNAFARVLAA